VGAVEAPEAVTEVEPPAPIAEEVAGEPTTSARNVDTAADREIMGVRTLDSAERKSFRQSLSQAREEGIPAEALRLAAAVRTAPRTLSDTETAGLVIKAAELKNEHASQMAQIADIDDSETVRERSAQISRIEQEFDNITEALKLAGTEAGRALAVRRLTINQDYRLVSVLNRAKATKGGNLSAAERTRFEEMDKGLNDALVRIAELEQRQNEILANTAVRAVKKRKAPKATRQTLSKRLNELLDAGCDDRG